MNKVDWSKSPEGAEFYGQGLFWRIINKMHCYYDKASDGWLLPEHWHHPTKCGDYEQKPAHTSSTSDALDWNIAPKDAQYYANKAWWKANDVKCGWLVFVDGVWLCAESTVTFAHSPFFYDDVISKADHIVDANEKAWPESDERVNIIGQNGNDGLVYEREQNKYERHIIGLDGTKTTVDVYRVLDAFKTESAAIDHAVKKLLCAGIRHQKDRKQDLEEAIKSIKAELLLMSQR